MAQLTDDCFTFSGPLLAVEEAARLMMQQVPVLTETETLPLAQAHGRVLAADVVAPVPLPPFDNSAVDGYAVRHADIAAAGPTALRISARVAAGIGAPVKMRIASPGPSGREAVAPAATRADTFSAVGPAAAMSAWRTA